MFVREDNGILLPTPMTTSTDQHNPCPPCCSVTVVCTGAVVAAVWFGGMEGIRRSESGGFQSTRVSRSGGEVFPTPASGGASGNKDGYGAI